MTLNKELLTILVCPKCKSDVSLIDQEQGLYCSDCAVVYPIKEDIPVMLIKESISKESWDKGERGS